MSASASRAEPQDRGAVAAALSARLLTAADAAALKVHGRTQAAVLVPLFLAEGELHVVLTRRRDDLRRHAGEVSFPGGRRDPEDRDLQVTALREAEEEIGLKIGKLRKIGSVVPSAGTLTERMHLFIAEVSAADKTEDGGGNPHEGEDIEVVEVALPELFGMARRGEIEDAKTLILVQRLLLEETEAGRRY